MERCGRSGHWQTMPVPPSQCAVRGTLSNEVTMTSPYEVLGVSSGASDEAIRAAFRKAAKACHPDLNDGDEVAARRFKEIAAARDTILKNRKLHNGKGHLLVGRTFDLREFDDTSVQYPQVY